MSGDFKFVTELLSDFFKGNHVRKTLSFIHAEDITGWEGWLQIEMAKFLCEDKRVYSCNRERSYIPDKRATDKSGIRVDIVFEKAGSRGNSLNLIEFKRRKDMERCLDAMIDDAVKLACIKPSGRNFRGAWVVGLYETEGRSGTEVDTLAKEFMHRKIVCDGELLIRSNLIGTTGYAYTVLGADIQ